MSSTRRQCLFVRRLLLMLDHDSAANAEYNRRPDQFAFNGGKSIRWKGSPSQTMCTAFSIFIVPSLAATESCNEICASGNVFQRELDIDPQWGGAPQPSCSQERRPGQRSRDCYRVDKDPRWLFFRSTIFAIYRLLWYDDVQWNEIRMVYSCNVCNTNNAQFRVTLN